jgi:hypothetical protein
MAGRHFLRRIRINARRMFIVEVDAPGAHILRDVPTMERPQLKFYGAGVLHDVIDRTVQAHGA